MRVLIYDKSIKPRRLAWAFFFGQLLYRLRGTVDVIKGVSSLKEMAEFLVSLEKVDEVEFWGHASPGRFYVNEQAMALGRDLKIFEDCGVFKKLQGTKWWFRACNLFTGPSGKWFAREWAKMFNAQVAGHTFVVWVWQSGLYTLKPGERPIWPDEEGVNGDKKVWSTPWKPNTVLCLQSRIPDDY